MTKLDFPKISIVTPSFNQGEYLEQTIDSVLSQGYTNLEYIIIDGGSSDNSVEVIKKFEKHIDFWVSEKDSGQSHAINKGLSKCTGEVFNWLCSDDYLEPGALNAIGKAFQNPNTLVVSGDIRVFDNDKIDYIKPGTQLADNLPESIATSVNIQPATFFRLQHFKDAGLLNPHLDYFMDKELWMKFLFENGQDGFIYLDQLIAHYLLHPQSKTFQEMDPEMYNPSSKFKIDNNSIFNALAIEANDVAKSNAIKSLTSHILTDYNFDFISNNGKLIIPEVLDYYLYHEAKKNFYKSNFKKCKDIIRVINKSNLKTEYQKDLKYFRRKSVLKSLF